jgi:HEAT repeat protein
MVEHGAAARRRAAAWALGEMHDAGSLDVLASALAVRDDRLVGDAAWAIGEILAAHPGDRRASGLVDRLLHVTKHGGWAGAIDSTAAIARLLWAAPENARGALLAGDRRARLLALVFHKSRLVRINAAHALATLPAADDVHKALVQLLRDDTSPHVRIAAGRALARIGGAKAKAALQTAATGDGDKPVRAALAAALASPPGPPPARTEWRSFYVVDPGDDDAPVRQERYLVHTADDLVWASYTDARGELNSEHVPPGEATVWSATRENEY